MPAVSPRHLGLLSVFSKIGLDPPAPLRAIGCNAHARPIPRRESTGEALRAGGGGAAIDGTDVVARRESPDGPTLARRVEPFLDQLAEQSDESRMRPDRPGADHVQTQLAGRLAGLLVEIIEHFEVVGEEADWMDDDVAHA